MKPFSHPHLYALAVKSTDFSYKIVYTARVDYSASPIFTPLRDKYTSSLWLSRFAIHIQELALKVAS